MPFLQPWNEIVKRQEPLAPYTFLRLGGPAQAMVSPRSLEELAAIVKACQQAKQIVRVLGGGSNLLVKDEGVAGVVLRLHAPAFSSIDVSGQTVRVATGATLAQLISESARHSLAGLEPLIGIPGTVGGAIRCNVGTRVGTLTPYLKRITLLDPQGQQQSYDADDLPLEQLHSPNDHSILIAAEFHLEKDDSDAILKRMRKFWIQRKARQPLSFQAVGRLFKHSRGMNVGEMLEEAGVRDVKVGGAALSERNLNYVVVEPGATARDVLRLIDLVRAKVEERLGINLAMALMVW